MRVIAWAVFGVFLAPALIALAVRACSEQPHWRVASHDSAGLAPAPDRHQEAVVQAYAARTWGTRGGVAVHTWLALKRSGADRYTRLEVIGWGLERAGSAVVRGRPSPPDAMWFSNPPQLLADVRGAGVDAVIDNIEAAAAAYPHAAEYETWPGPNSNTFIAHIARQVPALRLDIPPTAIGKDYLPGGAFAAPAPSGTGWQLSLRGFAGVLVALQEGVEVNLLGLSAGLRVWPPAIRLPGLGTWPAGRVATRRLTAPAPGATLGGDAE